MIPWFHLVANGLLQFLFPLPGASFKKPSPYTASEPYVYKTCIAQGVTLFRQNLLGPRKENILFDTKGGGESHCRFCSSGVFQP